MAALTSAYSLLSNELSFNNSLPSLRISSSITPLFGPDNLLTTFSEHWEIYFLMASIYSDEFSYYNFSGTCAKKESIINSILHTYSF